MIKLTQVLRDLITVVEERRSDLFVGNASGSIDLEAHTSAFAASFVWEKKLAEIVDHKTDKTLLQLHGRFLGQAVHLECQAAYGGDGAILPDVESNLVAVETSYKSLVESLRVAAIRKSPDYVLFLLGRLTKQHCTALLAMLKSLSLPETAQEHLVHARACHVGRRTAMLAAFTPLLYYRLMDNRLANSTQKLAERREVTMAPGAEDVPFVTSFEGLEPASRVVFVGRVDEAVLIDRPGKPYTRLQTAENEELRVHFKNTRWVGVGEAQSVWVRCKVEPEEDGIVYAVAEFEGPTTSEGTIWESWIQSLVRDDYDLAPESIHWFASFPPLASTLAPLNFGAHAAKGERNV